MADIISVLVAFEGLPSALHDARALARGIEEIGDSAEKSGKAADRGWQGVAKWAGGAVAAYGAQRVVRSAISDLQSLAKETANVQRQTSLDTVTASSWVSQGPSRSSEKT